MVVPQFRHDSSPLPGLDVLELSLGRRGRSTSLMATGSRISVSKSGRAWLVGL